MVQLTVIGRASANDNVVDFESESLSWGKKMVRLEATERRAAMSLTLRSTPAPTLPAVSCGVTRIV